MQRCPGDLVRIQFLRLKHFLLQVSIRDRSGTPSFAAFHRFYSALRAEFKPPARHQANRFRAENVACPKPYAKKNG